MTLRAGGQRPNQRPEPDQFHALHIRVHGQRLIRYKWMSIAWSICRKSSPRNLWQMLNSRNLHQVHELICAIPPLFGSSHMIAILTRTTSNLKFGHYTLHLLILIPLNADTCSLFRFWESITLSQCKSVRKKTGYFDNSIQ